MQISDTQVLSANAVNETRFQYVRARDSQIAQNLDPTIMVQGAFTGGGSNAGVVRDNQDRFEMENDTTEAKGAHAIEFGARFRLTRDANFSTSGFNGNYIYSSLSAYAAKTPSEYDVTAGKASSSVALFDAGVFFQDDFKVRPNLTLSYGLRYEAQNGISDRNDWAPRLSLAWAPAGGREHPRQDRDPRRVRVVLRSLQFHLRPRRHPAKRSQSAAARGEEPLVL